MDDDDYDDDDNISEEAFVDICFIHTIGIGAFRTGRHIRR